MIRCAALLALLSSLQGLPLHAQEPEAAPQEASEPALTQSGLASWYGQRFHGRRTASGERFDMHAFTAAHRTLPFGTLVKVENPDNGRSVEVRINDRGPHVKKRVIDLSRAAARALGLMGSGGGLHPVNVTVLGRVPESID